MEFEKCTIMSGFHRSSAHIAVTLTQSDLKFCTLVGHPQAIVNANFVAYPYMSFAVDVDCSYKKFDLLTGLQDKLLAENQVIALERCLLVVKNVWNKR